jgi:CNT family concentrative nucleoside transporter
LALNIGGRLLAFLSLIALVNGVLNGLGAPTLQTMLGYAFAPVAWLLGVAWNDCQTIGQFLGTRLVLNEFVAFIELGKVKAQLDPRSFTIATFALCGFANLSSVAIQVGGLGALMPARKSDIARLGMRAVMAGTMANFMSACIAGMLL